LLGHPASPRPSFFTDLGDVSLAGLERALLRRVAEELAVLAVRGDEVLEFVANAIANAAKVLGRHRNSSLVVAVTFRRRTPRASATPGAGAARLRRRQPVPCGACRGSRYRPA